jgi:hypothetical protein
MTAIFAAHAYDDLADSLAQKRIDIDSDTLKCLLMATYTPDTSHTFLDEVKAAGTEASGTGYTAGGVTLTSVTWTKTSGVWALKATIPAWDATGGALTGRYAIFYDATPGTDATRPVIAYWDLANNADVTATDNTFTLTQHASGIVTVDAA